MCFRKLKQEIEVSNNEWIEALSKEFWKIKMTPEIAWFMQIGASLRAAYREDYCKKEACLVLENLEVYSMANTGKIEDAVVRKLNLKQNTVKQSEVKAMKTTRVFEEFGIFISIIYSANLDREPSWKFRINTIDEERFESPRIYDYNQCVK